MERKCSRKYPSRANADGVGLVSSSVSYKGLHEAGASLTSRTPEGQRVILLCPCPQVDPGLYVSLIKLQVDPHRRAVVRVVGPRQLQFVMVLFVVTTLCPFPGGSSRNGCCAPWKGAFACLQNRSTKTSSCIHQFQWVCLSFPPNVMCRDMESHLRHALLLLDGF